MFLSSKKETEYRDRVIAYKHLFSSEKGRVVLFDLMNKYHILNPHSGEPFDEGQRSVVLEMMRLANINLTELDKMLQGDV